MRYRKRSFRRKRFTRSFKGRRRGYPVRSRRIKRRFISVGKPAGYTQLGTRL